MKKIWDSVKKDLWVVVLDIVAVNVAYFLALMIRYSIDFNFKPMIAEEFVPTWGSFAPWYTILCLIVFAFFRLYGGIWQYAGIHDMNRIISASAVTLLIQVAGTAVFFKRMPISYYLIGSFLQFFFIVAIRFGYRALMVEKKRLQKWKMKKGRALVVGAGENGRKVIRHLDEMDTLYPVAIYDPHTSGVVNGIPIVNEFNIENIEAVFIADPQLTVSERWKIREECEKAGVELEDYTGFYMNLGGSLSLTDLLHITDGRVTMEINGEERTFASGTEALQAITQKYQVEQIQGDIRIQLKEKARASVKEILAREYAAQLGEEYSSLEEGSDR